LRVEPRRAAVPELLVEERVRLPVEAERLLLDRDVPELFLVPSPPEEVEEDLRARLPEEAERPVPLAFSAAPEARWLALRRALLAAEDFPPEPAPLRLLPEEEEDLPLLLLPEELPPPSTFWAASATASAIRAPSLPTLAAMALAALPALSAASRPASRILRRTDGLALIAAAAAARPAASISLLIAALASLSIVSFMEELPLPPPAAPLSRLPPLLAPPDEAWPPGSGLFWLVKEAFPPSLFDFDDLPLATCLSSCFRRLTGKTMQRRNGSRKPGQADARQS
jgi:hypothetical protein